jgi:hypothetical protein
MKRTDAKASGERISLAPRYDGFQPAVSASAAPVRVSSQATRLSSVDPPGRLLVSCFKRCSPRAPPSFSA